MPQTWIDCLRILLSFQLLFIQADEFFAAAHVLPKTIVSDPVKPGRKSRFAAKAPDILVSANKSFLRQIISQRNICAGELPKQATYCRLVPAHEFAERVLVLIDKNSRDECRISELHVRTLWHRWRRRNVLPAFQLPHDEISESDQEWNQPQRPCATFPIARGTKEDHGPETDHRPNNSAAHV